MLKLLERHIILLAVHDDNVGNCMMFGWSVMDFITEIVIKAEISWRHAACTRYSKNDELSHKVISNASITVFGLLKCWKSTTVL